jgi:hypothetical protein
LRLNRPRGSTGAVCRAVNVVVRGR